MAMFPINLTYLAILKDVALHYCLPYVGCVHEITEDGIHVYGVEIQLPAQLVGAPPRTLFFWADAVVDDLIACEAAALQGLVALQGMYGFRIADYSAQAIRLRSLAQRLLPVANRGAHLARLVLAASHHQNIPLSALVLCAEDLLYEVSFMSQESSMSSF